MSTTVTRPNFIVDPQSLARTTGKQISWADTDASNYGTTPDRMIPKGSQMVALSSGQLVTYADRPGTEAAVYVMETDVHENPKEPNASAYGVLRRGVLWENALPGVDGSGNLPAAVKTDLEAQGFQFERLTDTRTGVS